MKQFLLSLVLCGAALAQMPMGGATYAGTGGGGGLTASINLNPTTPGTASCTFPAGTIGRLNSTPCVVTMTNTSGSTLNMYSNYSPSGWGTGTTTSVQYDGDAVARTWNNGLITSPTTTTPLTNGGVWTLNVYIQPSIAASPGGHVYIKDNNNTLLGTITVNGSNSNSAPAFKAAPDLPIGIAADYSGTTINTTWPNTTGYTLKTVCPSGCDFTTLGAALTFASTNCGSTGVYIKVTANTVLTENPTLPANNCTGSWSGNTWTGPWVIIASSDINQSTGQGTTLPAKGTRVQNASCDAAGQCRPSATQTAAMFTLQSASGTPALRTAVSAGHYRIVGALFTSTFTPDATQHGILYLTPDDSVHPSVASELADGIVLDRVYGHTKYQPSNSNYTSVVFALDGTHVALIDSYCDSDGSAQEVQCITISANESGPYKIVNNWIQHSGEPIFFGGADSRIAGQSPHDIEVRNNYIFKPLTWNPYCLPPSGGGSNPCSVSFDGFFSSVPAAHWAGSYNSGTTYAAGDVVSAGGSIVSSGLFVSKVNSNLGNTPVSSPTQWFEASRTVKNCAESKKGSRQLWIGNTLSGAWAGAQDGSCWLMETTDQAGSDIFATNSDMTFVNNTIVHGYNTTNFATASYAYSSQAMMYVMHSNNLSYDIGAYQYNPSPCSTPGNTCGSQIENFGPDRNGTSNPGSEYNGWYEWWTHNTFAGVGTNGSSSIAVCGSTAWPAVNTMTFSSNIMAVGAYGFLCSSGGFGNSAFTTVPWFQNLTFSNNVLAGLPSPGGSTDANYLTGQIFKPSPASLSAVGFAGLGTNDYRLCTGSGTPAAGCTGASTYHNACDGGTTDCGANIAALPTCTQSGTSCNPNP